MTVCTGPFRWFKVVHFSRTVPRSGRVVEGRTSMTSATALIVSSGRTGLSQRTLSNPGDPRLWVRMPVCRSRRKVTATVWMPLAIRPPP